jgi:allantoin racemase
MQPDNNSVAQRHLLLINPNTSESVTALLGQHATMAAGPAVVVHTQTARFGAPYIACEASYAVAGHATLDAWAYVETAQPKAPFDAILIGCFGDPGLMALRECTGLPVTGLAEASFIQAAAIGRFAIVTGGTRWKPMLERLAKALGLDANLGGIHTVAPSGAELARDPIAAQALLQAACIEAMHAFDAQAIILGGAGLAGMAQSIQTQVPVAIIDSVTAGVAQALGMPQVAMALEGTEASTPARTFDFAWHKVSAALSVLGA